jgi:hypothetical protein
LAGFCLQFNVHHKPSDSKTRAGRADAGKWLKSNAERRFSFRRDEWIGLLDDPEPDDADDDQIGGHDGDGASRDDPHPEESRDAWRLEGWPAAPSSFRAILRDGRCAASSG